MPATQCAAVHAHRPLIARTQERSGRFGPALAHRVRRPALANLVEIEITGAYQIPICGWRMPTAGPGSDSRYDDEKNKEDCPHNEETCAGTGGHCLAAAPKV